MSKSPEATTRHETFPQTEPVNGSLPPSLSGLPIGSSAATSRTVPRHSASKSALGRYWLVAFISLVVVGGGLAYYFTRNNNSRDDVLIHTVRKEQLVITVIEKGQLESSDNRDIVCKVRAGSKGFASTINKVIEDGARVKGGEELMVLDDSALKDQEEKQSITVRQAEATMLKAEKDYQICKEETEGAIEAAQDKVDNARIDLEKYTGIRSDPTRTPLGALVGGPATLVESGTFRQELDDLNGQISIKQSEVEQNRERSDWASRMVKQSYMAPAQAQSEKSRLDGSVESLRSLQAKRDQLVTYDRRQKLTTLRGAYNAAVRELSQARLNAEAKQATAKSEWDTSKAVLTQQKESLDDLGKQRNECKVCAPLDIKDGSMVVYFKQEGGRSFGGSNPTVIEQGAQVKEGQKMLRIPNLDKMQVNVKVHEAMVSRIKVGQRTMMKVEAMADRQFVGTVKYVSSVANATDPWMQDVKLYLTVVRVEGELGPDGSIIPISGEILKPDMTAEVTINVDAVKEPVATVPIQAVLGGVEMGRTRDVFVKNASGGFDRRPVKLGLFNDKMVEVRDGLNEGEEVVTNPKVLLSDQDKTKTREPGDLKTDTEKPPEQKPTGGGNPSGGAPGGGYPGGDPTKGTGGAGPPGGKGTNPGGNPGGGKGGNPGGKGGVPGGPGGPPVGAGGGKGAGTGSAGN